MISKNELKYYNSLLQKKFRSSEKKFLVEGKKIVLDGLNSGYKCDLIFFTERFAEKEEEYFLQLKSFGKRIAKLKSVDFKKVSDTRSPEGIAAVFEIKKKKLNLSTLTDPILIYLGDISDPGNLGTIIRNCDWFGIKQILLSKETAEIYNPKVVRSSMGSVFNINIFEDVALEEIAKLKEYGYEFLCADVQGDSIYEFKIKDRVLIFISNESRGPSDKLISYADRKVTIPGKGKAESLNVSSASAILLAELTR
jgi:TrmH family RNA methyltransferase